VEYENNIGCPAEFECKQCIAKNYTVCEIYQQHLYRNMGACVEGLSCEDYYGDLEFTVKKEEVKKGFVNEE
jgi:hypothetical protein